MALQEITASNFSAQVLESDQPVLVDFWAPWCGPCKAIGPVIEKVAAEYEGRAKVGKINVDSEPALANQFSVMSIPTLLIFVKGKVHDQIVGLTKIEKIREKLDSTL